MPWPKSRGCPFVPWPKSLVRLGKEVQPDAGELADGVRPLWTISRVQFVIEDRGESFGGLQTR